ncbi:hypothetical protein ACHQM5_022969 [Ranunculus cassubicifolius]
MWCSESGCRDAVLEGMNMTVLGSPSYVLCRKLTSCRQKVCFWNRHVFGNVDTTLNEIQKQIEQLQPYLFESGVPNDYLLAHEQELLIDYEDKLHQKEAMWYQKSRLTGYQLGDSNTRYFHTVAIKRRRRNEILRMKNHLGVMVYEEPQIANILVDYYGNLFTSDELQIDSEFLNVIPQLVEQNDNDSLQNPITDSEIKSALHSIGSTKSPAIYWDIVGPQLCSMVKYFFTEGSFVKEINHAHVILIPKEDGAAMPESFRPISLLNVSYKVISKLMVNRLRPILQKLISPQQSAFLPKRAIQDNVLVAHELFHLIKSRANMAHKYFAMKLDMKKAYDRVEWNYLAEVLKKFGFSQWWIDRVMFCVTSASFSVSFNGGIYGHLKPTRGLRQGDPLSPYLFILCSEVLSLHLQELQENGQIKGISLGRDVAPINHLMYADDLLIFGKCELDQLSVIKHLLQWYCQASGQAINIQKSKESRSYMVTMIDRSYKPYWIGLISDLQNGRRHYLTRWVG